jgi:MFS family permease
VGSPWQSPLPYSFAHLIIIAGYCVGPLAWGPLSEQYGRRPIFVISFGLYTVRALNFTTCQEKQKPLFLGTAQILQIACAVAPSGPTLLIFRFLSGCFAAAPLTNSGAILADMCVNLFVHVTPSSPN